METEKAFENLELSENQKWENLGISSDYIFGKVMLDKELCLELIRLILPEMEIVDISIPQSQRTLKPDMDARGVRFDVFVRDTDGTVFDIEMEVRFSKYLPMRSRYYGSMIDMNLLDAGTDYKELKPSVIIFICPFDLFGQGLHRYTFRNTCIENNAIELGDGTTKIFLNAEGIKDDVSPELKAFLDLVVGKAANGEYARKIEAAVGKAKEKREWRLEYMTLMMRDKENIALGVERGAQDAKRAMTLKLYHSGVSIDTIASAAEVDSATVKTWIEEEKTVFA